MLRVLGRTPSINVRKVLWTLDELDLPYEHVADWATAARPATLPEFLQLNPNAQVPVLEDAHGVWWESNTICRYLAHTHGRSDLLPAEPQRRARVEQWMDWQATDLNSAWRPAFPALARNDPTHAAAAVAASVANWTGKMRILDAQLARSGGYVTGADFTVADVVLGLSVHRYLSTPLAHAELPAVQRYVARLAERAGFRRYATAATP
jgi:glutathione S-transferase